MKNKTSVFFCIFNVKITKEFCFYFLNLDFRLERKIPCHAHMILVVIVHNDACGFIFRICLNKIYKLWFVISVWIVKFTHWRWAIWNWSIILSSILLDLPYILDFDSSSKRILLIWTLQTWICIHYATLVGRDELIMIFRLYS